MAALLLTASPMLAEASTTSHDVAASLVALTEEAAASVAPSTPAGDAAPAALSSVALPGDRGEDIVLTSAEGQRLDVPLPAIGQLAATTADGSYVQHTGAGADAVVASTVEDGVRLTAVVHSEVLAESIAFPLPADTDAEVQPDGSVLLRSNPEAVVTEDGSTFTMSRPVALIERPWAVDGSGRELTTAYDVVGGAIIQEVDVDAATTYPIVADPTYRLLNPIQMLIRWNRAETATIAAGGWGATGITAVCAAVGAALGPVGIALLGGACLAFSGAAVYTAGVANSSMPRRCLEATASAIPGVPILLFNTWGC